MAKKKRGKVVGSKNRVLICGAGSIGVYLGAKLHSKGHDVTLFGRRKLRKTGDKILIENKKFNLPEKIFKIPKNEEYDFVFIATKLYDLEEMVLLIKKNKIKSSTFIMVQNGLVDISKYARLLKNKIVPIVVFSGFNIKGDEIMVNQTSVGWIIENSQKGKMISRFLFNVGIPCKTDKNFNSLRAEKAIVNSCLNALSAIENKSFCDLFKNRRIRERIEKLFEESYKILEKEYKLENAEKLKKRMFKNWSRLNHYSSTHQDLYSGRKVEVDFFNGYIIKLGKKNNLPVKYNQEIIADIDKINK